MPKDDRTRNWTFLLYPESAPADWKARLDDLHIPYVLSPLHDKDLNATGEPKKAHYHIVLCYENKKSYEQVKAITDDLSQPIPKRVESLVGMIRYLTHIDNPEKAQYQFSDIQSFGGIDVFKLYCSSTDKKAILRDICNFILEHDIIEFHEIYTYALYNEPNWFDLLSDSHTLVITSFIKSRRHDVRLAVDRIGQKERE